MPRKKPAAPTPSPAPSAASRAVELLAEEGYRPEQHEDEGGWASVHFKSEGVRHVLWVDEDDPDYFRVSVTFSLPGDTDFAAALDRANQLNERVKGVKTVVSAEERAVMHSVESFLEGAPTAKLLERALDALRTAARDFTAPVRSPDHLDA